MNDRERLLRDSLERARVPDEAAAEERAWRVVAAATAAGAARPPRRGRRRALQMALALGLIALVVSPAGASVRSWVAERIEPGAPHARPFLASLPGDGSLLVDSAQGPWVVHPDGSKRLLGDYAESSWSPHGLYAVVSDGHELAAVEPGGAVRWTLTRPGRVGLARWNGPDGFRIAYVEGDDLRVVAGDGSGDRRVATGVAPVAPAWRAGPAHELAYATRGGAVVAMDADTGRRIFETIARSVLAAASRSPITSLQWVGSDLLVTRPERLQMLGAGGRPLWTWTPPPGARIVAASAAADGGRVAVVVRAGRTSRVLLRSPAGAGRVLFAGPGAFAAPRWSPDGRWLLIPWRSADQWLFLEPSSGTAKLHAVARVAQQFSPGDPAAARFPSVTGWCCTR
ncbi:MAG: PD40 domain-containing protein [Actinobacteria bacterium]|nr:PD40 domain-containing protein [Actinomycetota bacterium]